MSSVTFTITVTIDEEDELAFKHEFRALATKHMAFAPPEGFFGNMTEKERNEVRDKRLKEKEIKDKQIVLADKPDDPDFENLNTKCWRRYGLPRNLVGETFKDNPDDSDLMQKIIGYQTKNEQTPVISIDEHGIKNKWSIQQMCTYFGFTRGLVVEEMSSSEDSLEEANKLKKQINKDESEDSEDSSSSCIEVTTVGSTVIKNPNVQKAPVNPVKQAPAGPTKTISKVIQKVVPRKLPQIYKDLELSPESPKRTKMLPQLSRIIPSNMPHLPKELETMTDTELSKYYGFEKNMIGTVFNFPTPKKGMQRLYDILGFDIRKAKYPVVAMSQSTKKPQNFSVEEILEHLKNPIKK